MPYPSEGGTGPIGPIVPAGKDGKNGADGANVPPDIQVADVARRYGVSRTTLYKHVGVVLPRFSSTEKVG